MLYLIDANVLITAHNLYYPVNGVPEFWAWLSFRAAAGDIKMPLEVYEEVKDGGTDEERDLLFGWITDEENKAALVLDEEVDPELVARVVDQGYAADQDDPLGRRRPVEPPRQRIDRHPDQPAADRQAGMEPYHQHRRHHDCDRHHRSPHQLLPRLIPAKW